jgi:hypothetical protein
MSRSSCWLQTSGLCHSLCPRLPSLACCSDSCQFATSRQASLLISEAVDRSGNLWNWRPQCVNGLLYVACGPCHRLDRKDHLPHGYLHCLLKVPQDCVEGSQGIDPWSWSCLWFRLFGLCHCQLRWFLLDDLGLCRLGREYHVLIRRVTKQLGIIFSSKLLEVLRLNTLGVVSGEKADLLDRSGVWDLLLLTGRSGIRSCGDFGTMGVGL